MSNIPRLSLCMIVKDEEDCIARCLNSVKDFVDEMVIVDTGSSDQTMEICRSFGAKVYSYPWNGNFADARNFGLAYVTGDWIMWLDADEEFELESKEELYKQLNSGQYDIFSLHLINYTGDTFHPDKTIEVNQIRLFRNHTGLKFIHPIHEILNIEHLQENDKRIGYVNAKIHHYGYLNERVEKKQKVKRNIKIIKKELQQEDDIWKRYYLAAEYFRSKNYPQALKEVSKVIERASSDAVLLASFVYEKKISILLAMGRLDEALLEIERALELYPDYVDLIFHKGTIFLHKKQYPEAIQAFQQCIELGDENRKHQTVKGVGSFLAWFFKGGCQEKFQQWDDALFSYSMALNLQYVPAFDHVMRVLHQSFEMQPATKEILFSSIESLLIQQKETKALQLIERLEAIGISDSQLMFIKGAAFLEIGLFAKAKKLLTEIPISHSSYMSAMNSLCMIAWLEENYDEADTFLKQLESVSKYSNSEQAWRTCLWIQQRFIGQTTDDTANVDQEFVFQLFCKLLELNKITQADKLVPFLEELEDVNLKSRLFECGRQYGRTSWMTKQTSDNQEDPLLLAETLFMQQNLPKARRLYKNLLKSHPQPDLVRMKLAAALLLEAKELLLTKVSAYPKLKQTAQALSSLKAKLESSQSAAQHDS